MHGNTLFDVSTTEIRPYLLVVIGIQEEKKKNVRNPKVYISPYCPDDPLIPIATIFDKVGGIHEVMKCTKFGVDWFIGLGSAGS